MFTIVAFGEKRLGLKSSQGRRALNEKLYAGRKVAGIQKSVTWGKMQFLTTLFYHLFLVFGSKQLKLSWSGAKQAINEKLAHGRKMHKAHSASWLKAKVKHISLQMK